MWKIDNGTLRIKPYNGSDGADSAWFIATYKPWKEYSDQITAISIEDDCWFKGNLDAAFAGLTALRSADLSGLNLFSIDSLWGLLSNCPSLESVTFGPARKSNAEVYSYMFRGCTSLRSIDLSGVISPRAVSSISRMFENCTALESIDISGLKASKDTEMGYVFSGSTALRSITVGDSFTFHGEDANERMLPSFGPDYTTKLKNSVDGASYAWSEIPDNVAATYTLETDARELLDISEAHIYGMSALYTDDENVPSDPIVTLNNEALIRGVDYNLESVHDYEACPGEPMLGKWEYVIRGKGDYMGQVSCTYYVKHVVQAPEVAIGLVYNGTEQSCLEPSAVVPPMVKIHSEKQKNPGNYAAWAYFEGEDADFYMWDNRKDEIPLYWSIARADADTVLAIVGYEHQHAWTGSCINPKVQVYVPWQEKPLVEGQDYLVSYGENTDVGTASITVSPNENYYEGNKTVEFEIVDEVPGPEPGLSGAWKGSAGKWWYQYSDGSYLKSCWKDIDGARYYFDGNGYAAAGWASIDGSWYWFDPSTSAMQTGWQNIGRTWYFFLTGSGSMVTGWLSTGVDDYFFDGSGAMRTGWVQYYGEWYWFGVDGRMTQGWQNIGGTWYYLGSSGAMATGWKAVGGTWYWFDGFGAMATGWQWIGGTYYCFDGSGAMQHDRWVGDYYLTGSGAMATNQWVGPYYVGSDGKWVR